MRNAIHPADRPVNRKPIKQIEIVFYKVVRTPVTVTEEVTTDIRDALRTAQMKLIATKQDNEEIECCKWQEKAV